MQVAMLVAAIIILIISMNMGVQAYHIVVKKKEDQLQYIRTPEGEYSIYIF